MTQDDIFPTRSLYLKYRENRLKHIRENSTTFIKLVLFQQMCVGLFVLCTNLDFNSPLAMIRLGIMISGIITEVLILKLVEKYELIVSYFSLIAISVFGVYCTEMTTNLRVYGLYEGFLSQIGMSYLASVSLAIDWMAPCITQAIIYIYSYYRISSAFEGVSSMLCIAFLNVIFFYTMCAYMNCRANKREFLANYNQKKTAESFQNVCSNLPEGVAIIGEESQLNFMNSKMKNLFDPKEYLEDKGDLVELKQERKKRLEEFEEDMQKLGKGMEGELSVDHVLDKWKVKVKYQESENSFLESEEDKELDISKESFTTNSLLSTNEEIADLSFFLKQQREDLKAKKKKMIETKAILFLDPINEKSDFSLLERQFIIKTLITQKKIMHIFMDTTQIIQLEEAKAQNKYQRQMLANVSHEFRTPINAMNMSLMMLKDRVEEEQMKFVKIAINSCSILGSLVEDILDHAKIEAGMFEIHETSFEPNELLEEVKEIFELQMKHKNLKFNITMAHDLKKILIRTDKGRLKQVLMNLLSNALKFTDYGTISIALEKEEEKGLRKLMSQAGERRGSERSEENISELKRSLLIRPSILSKNYSLRPQPNNLKSMSMACLSDTRLPRVMDTTKLKLTVTDTGVGIPAKDQSKLFKLFGKVSSKDSRNQTGCGLGLTIVKKILTKLSGGVALHSEHGKGTKVECTFACGYYSKQSHF